MQFLFAFKVAIEMMQQRLLDQDQENSYFPKLLALLSVVA